MANVSAKLFLKITPKNVNVTAKIKWLNKHCKKQAV